MITPNILATPAPKAAGDLEISEANFPDPVFRAYVKEKLAKNNDTMTAEQVAKVKQIDVTYDDAGTAKKITNLKGIKNFTNLERLSCDSNDLKELPIAAMTNLKSLSCSGNALQELPIAAMTNLEWLFCDNNALKELSIANNTNLTVLVCNGNQLSALELTSNLLLEEVNCVDNLLKALNLENNTALTVLRCGFNELDKLDVRKNTNLIELGCQDNKLEALDVEVNTQLTSLFCQGNQLSSLILPAGDTLTLLLCYDNHLATLDLGGHQAVGTSPDYPSTIRPQTVAADLTQQPDGGYVLDMAAIVGLANIARVDTRMFVDGSVVSNIYNPTTGKASFTALPSTMSYYYQTEGSEKVALMQVNIPVDTFTITATADAAGGTITPEGATKVCKGGFQEYKFEAKDGYGLDKVTVDGIEVAVNSAKAGLAKGTYTITNVQANTAIHAAFTKKTDPQPPITYYSVTASAGDNGAINPVGTRIVPQGSSLEYKFAAKEGYELDVVTVNGTAVKPVEGAYTLSNIQGATTIHATFKKIPVYYTITASAGENGTVDPSGGVPVLEGASQTFTFTPKTGYVIDAVSVDEKAVTLASTTYAAADARANDAYTFTDVHADATLEVTFKKKEVPVDPVPPTPLPTPDPVPPADGGTGGNNNGASSNNGVSGNGGTTKLPAAPQAAALAAPATPATPATAAAKAAAPAKPTADTATPQDQPENSDLGAQGFDTQHSHIPLALLLLAVWLVGGFAVIRQRKHTHDAIERASY